MTAALQPSEFAGDGRPRVLVEAAEWSYRETLGEVLIAEGYDVASCCGPEGGDGRCALLMESGCRTCEQADVVVHTLRHTDPRNREVLLELRRRYPDKPLVVEVPGPRAVSYPTDFPGCHLLPVPLTMEALKDTVRAALAHETPAPLPSVRDAGQ